MTINVSRREMGQTEVAGLDLRNCAECGAWFMPRDEKDDKCVFHRNSTVVTNRKV